MEHPSGQFGSAVPALFIPSLLHTPSLLAGEQGKKESPVAEQCLHSVSQTPVYYQYCFSHKHKTQHHVGCYEENLLRPSQYI